MMLPRAHLRLRDPLPMEAACGSRLHPAGLALAYAYVACLGVREGYGVGSDDRLGAMPPVAQDDSGQGQAPFGPY